MPEKLWVKFTRFAGGLVGRRRGGRRLLWVGQFGFGVSENSVLGNYWFTKDTQLLGIDCNSKPASTAFL